MMCWSQGLSIAVIASCCLASVVLSDSEHNRIKRQASSPPQQPRIVTQDGNLVFQTGSNHNITFRSSNGGRVNIDGMDVKTMADQVSDHQNKLTALDGIQDQVDTTAIQLATLTTRTNTRIGNVNRKLTNTTRQVTSLVDTTGVLTNDVNNLRSTVNTMSTKIVFDNCASGPCHNGGTCIDMYDSFKCFCPVNWQGTTCSEDVNECAIYAGTAQGCHSGATCRNTNGGFSCDCPAGFTGVLCNVKAGRCSEGSNSQLCGFGTCIDGSGDSHTCLCQDGWEHDTATPPRCTRDINECEQVDKPCHDSVQCINVPGAYFCGPCPTGYTGNGHQCNDIDECLVSNGGCSQNPPVECINTLGSRSCGPCPAGYQKVSGELCVWVGQCGTNNGGCSSNAVCNENPAMPVRSCTCNPGYTGSGEGPNGCREITGPTPSPDACVPNPCQNGGNCFNPANTNAFTCSCQLGWTGHVCQTDINECDDNPCENGGTCTNTPGNYTCTCTEFSRGRNCQDLTYQCGGELSGETGNFRFPPANHDQYPHGISCAWRITTSLNKVINVRFSIFNIEFHSNCNYDFLQIHDGSTASSQMIGKYCGNLTTAGVDNITSTHNQLYMWFKTDGSVAGQGFALSWTSPTPICGGDIRDETSGTISSPGYPGVYPNNRTCVWTIRVPPGNNIQVHFVGVDLEAHANCSYDYLEFRNGLRETDTLIERYCNSTTPDTLHSEGNELFLKFASDVSQQHNGFMITWSAVPSAPNCGGSLNQTDGILISPNYPNNYDHNGDCVWVISIPVNQQIALNFTDFAMESSSTCLYDYIEIHDGTDDTAPLFGKFCGSEVPAMITSTGPNLYIRFHSDASVNNRGFRAQWTVACGGTFTDPTGLIASPYWPAPYPHSKTCNYLLSAAENQVIEVTFSDFGVESHSTCTFDGLRAYNGSSPEGGLIRPAMCGSALPTPLISTQNNMFLVFSTDGSVSDLGFRATYEFRNVSTGPDGTGCGAILTNNTGTILSPGHPNLYPHGVDCLWEIRVTPGFQIRLTFNFFSIEQTSTCAWDYVQISENRTNTNTTNLPQKLVTRQPLTKTDTTPALKTDETTTTTVATTVTTLKSADRSTTETAVTDSTTQSGGVAPGRYCGGATPPPFTSSDNVLYLRFRTDSSISHEGFSAQYISFNHTTWCGDERRSLPGFITSPGYPEPYPHQRECVWTIVAPDNHQIVLNITNFNLEAHTSCNYDYVEIRNGGNELSPLIGRFCGTKFETPIFSHSNRLWIKFKSDVSSSAAGFRIWYEDAGEGCGAELTGPTGMFLSPNYPTTYNRNAECYWTITVAQGSSIMLLFVDMDIEQHSSCAYDYVEAIEGLHTGRSIAKVCGTTPPQPIQSKGNVMTVKFRSDTSLGGRGFHAAYFSDCTNQVMNSSSGVIESPNFPNSYPHNRNCSWIINTSIGNVINVAFSHLDIEDDISGSSCLNDFLEIRDGPRTTDNVLLRTCGSEIPSQLNSTSNQLYVRFKSDASLAHNGFRLEYLTIANLGGVNGTNGSDIGCGGDLNSENGTFTSPNWPNPYPHNRECIWRITVPIGKRIQLNLNNMHLEFQTNCSYDFIEVLGGPDANSPSLTKICRDRNESHVVTSSGNQMYVRFKSDASEGGTGFQAFYTSIDAGCGGMFTTPTGNIQSPGYADRYPHNANCEWNITVAAFQTVQITFKDFDLEAHDSCIYDYVAIYDGLLDIAPELGRICGSNLTNTTYTSTSNTLRLRMRTDSSSNGRGFAASYKTACGGRKIVGDGVETIQSPNFPAPYEPNTNCTWTLMGALPVDRITLQFTAMDIEESQSAQGDGTGLCVHDSVRVLQGDNVNAPEHGRYCGTGVPASITSTGYAMTIIFSADQSVQQTGFSASYSKSTSFCGGNLTATHGAFSTPSYPDPYPRDAECVWYLNAAPGNRIQLSFTAFDLESTDGCNRDYVEIRDGRDTSVSYGRFCGQSIPTNVSVAQSMMVKFRSDLANQLTGFTAQFSTLTGGDMVGNTGQLASPLYPREYPHNADHTWTIIVDQGKKVRIQFVDFDIETGTTCQYDYLQFLDGAADTGPTELMKICGTTPPPPFSSTGNVMSVRFHTDVSATGRGFLFNWTAVDQVVTTPGPTLEPGTTPAGCSFELVATESAQNLTSPNWPENYDNGMDCTWTIRSTGGEKIELSIVTMDVESSSTCIYDALKIYDGANEISSRLLDTKCGRLDSTEPAVLSSGGVMKLRFTSDVSVTRQGFVLSYKTACGGILTGTSGVIESPNNPQVYPVNSSCQWLIQVLPGRTVDITVESFNLPNTNNCTGDRLRILNGDNTDSPSIESGILAYCGSPFTVSQKLSSASRFVWVEFTSDSVSDGNGNNFRLTYEEKSVACGGNLDIPDDDSFVGYFTSPGYGQSQYPHNADCAWVITAPTNARVQLDFPAFDLEAHPSCNYDYLMVRDGGTENSNQIAKLCGSDPQQTQRSTSNVMRVRLVTDNSVGKGGFNITYKKESCGGTLIGSTGLIESPQYPNNYPNNAECEWYIQGPTGHFLTLNFTNFQLSSSSPSDCTGQDTLTVRNRDLFGNVTDKVGDYCGRSAPPEIRTADSRAYIKFTSTSSNAFPGFSLNYYASVEECGGELTTPSGAIQSPNYPGYYAHSRLCTWKITVPQGRRITLNFDDFNIESQSLCAFDYVEIKNGHLQRSPRIGKFCGNNTAHSVQSSGNKVLIVFRSDGSISNGGFRISYTSPQDALCGGIIRPAQGAVGHITSPGYQETITDGDFNLTGLYPNSIQCEWLIEGSTAANSSIVLKFEPQRFKLEHHGECIYDFLMVREGVSSTGRDVGTFCSNLTNNVPRQVAVPVNQMWLAFVSDASVQHEGFNISYQFAPCGGVLQSDSGVITSPNYPNNYEHDMGCAWEIIAEEGAQIELTVEDFSLETSNKCEYDYVALYNGGSHTSPRIATLCQANEAGKSYISATNRLRIEFVSDFSQSAQGFRLSYNVRQSGCGGVFNELSGNLTSQNYPSNYPHNIECVWDIMLPDGYTVIMQNNGPFDVESGGSGTTECFYDYIEFFNVDSDGAATAIGPKYCGSTPPPVQTSSGKHLRVKFRSDRWTNGVGFNMSWTAGCGGTFDSDFGEIFSPGYPVNYAHNTLCDYVIVASPDQFIVIQFDDSNFRIESSSSCQYDHVEIFEGSVNGTSKGRYCGLTAPQPIATRGSMVVRFKTDADTADDGWKATYVKSECGGYLNGSAGQLQSPTHPVDYHNNLNCTWLIEVIPNRAVALRFETFDLEASSGNGNCQYDYLALYNGQSIDDSQLIGRYCGDVLPEDIKSSSNLMTVQFKTDASITKGGFTAVYQETYGEAQGCGGRLNGSSGTITPVRDTDGNYIHNLDCVWIITVPDNKIVSIALNDVVIESGTTCQYDGLELRDGFSSQDLSLTPTICGTRNNTVLTSSTNVVRVRFFSDASITGSGFSLSYTATDPLCGGVLQLQSNTTGSQQGVISSPNFPSAPSGTPVNCRWVIGAPSGEQVRLTVTDIGITGDCNQNYIQFRDQPYITQVGPGQNVPHCGTQIPHSFNSYGNEVQVNFKYGIPAASFSGFRLTYSIADCNRLFTEMDGRITSPGWPSNYPHSQDCYMNITLADTSKKIALYFNAFSMESHTNCQYDYLEVFDGPTAQNNSRVGKHCGSNIPDPIISSGNSMVIHMVTDGSVSVEGFDITYIASSTGCGGTITSISGGFASPTARDPVTCEWVIQLPTRLRPSLSFSVMDLRQNNTACPNAYVEVRNGGSSSSPLMGRFCNGEAPQLTGQTNQLYVKFYSSQTLDSEAKFIARYLSAEQGSGTFLESAHVLTAASQTGR